MRPTFLVVLLCVWSGAASAAGKTLPRPVYQKVERAQRLLAEDQPKRALAVLEQARGQVRGSYARAVVLQNLGYVQLELDRNQAAAKSFRAALELDALPADAALNLRYNLAQILAGIGRHREAISLLKAYLVSAGKSAPLRARLLLGQLYAMTGRYRAIPKLLAADAARAQRKSRPTREREQLLRLMVAARLELGQQRRAIAPLKTLLGWYPGRRDYWLRLVDVHQGLNQEAEALALLEAAHLHGRLARPAELRSLAGLYLRQGQPHSAATLIDAAIADGRIEPSAADLDLAAAAWQLSREQSRAAAALERSLAGDWRPEQARRLVGLYLDRERWQDAWRVCDQALARVGSDDERAALLLMRGQGLYRQGRRELARGAFERVVALEQASAAQARQWLAFLDYLDLQSGDEA